MSRGSSISTSIMDLPWCKDQKNFFVLCIWSLQKNHGSCKPGKEEKDAVTSYIYITCVYITIYICGHFIIMPLFCIYTHMYVYTFMALGTGPLMNMLHKTTL